MGGIFGNMFDFNRDGKLDSFERTMEFGFIQSLDKEVSGEIYDDDERREILEAGLDSDDFDF